MKILIVASYRSYSVTGMSAFVKDQCEALCKAGVCCEFFLIKGKGIKGYLTNFPAFKKTIDSFKPDVIHAHYGLSGLFANLQRKVPVVTTYHGSDINYANVLRFSRVCIFLSKWNIFVSQKLADKAKVRSKYSIIPCGVDLELFRPMDKSECRRKLGLVSEKKYILFSKNFSDPIKNYPLARASVDLLGGDVELLEFIGYTREQSALLMNAVDAAIMTSFSEGSPQFIKEAMACGCPVVSVNVGDVVNTIGSTMGCYIVDRNAEKIATALRMAVSYGKTDGHLKMKLYGNNLIADKILQIYSSL